MSDYSDSIDYMGSVATQLEQTPAERIAERAAGVLGRNDDARLTASCDALSAVAGHVSREYGDYGYRIGQVANAGGGGVFSVRTPDGSTFYLAADRYGNVARLADEF